MEASMYFSRKPIFRRALRLFFCLLFLLHLVQPAHAEQGISPVPGTVRAWGGNYYGQLGDGSTTQRTTPVLVNNLTGVTAIATDGYKSMALKSDGTVWSWGYNYVGQLGDGTTTSRTSPVQVSDLTGVTAVAAGGNHSLALKSNGTVWSWGYNVFGQLGDNTNTNRSTPVQVSNLSNVTALAAGYYFSMALRSNGTVWAWGANDYYQLGDGTYTARRTPVQVSGLSNVTAISAGYYHSLALKSDGTVWAWGDNDDGQLGDGTHLTRSTPVQVQTISGIVAICAGWHHSLALRSDGTVLAWGRNGLGQLGDGTTTSRTSPVVVTGMVGGVTAIAAGNHGLALKSDGSIWAWGDNGKGQLGDGTTTRRTTPVMVSALSGATAIAAAGDDHSLAIAAAPASFYKSLPVNAEASTPVNPTLSWGASSGTTAYEYCIDTNHNNACDTNWINMGTNTSAALSGLASGATYSWQVRATNSNGTSYADGNIWWTFTTQAALPGSFNKVAPVQGFTGAETNLTLGWSASDGAAYYEFCYDTTVNDTCDGAWINTGAQLNSEITGLGYNTTYSWQVRAVNSGGTTEADSGWWSFSTIGAKASFNADPLLGETPLLVHFTNLSEGAYDTCVWDFGDSTQTTGCTSIEHVYQTPGVFTVSLTISGPGGSLTHILTDYIQVSQGHPWDVNNDRMVNVLDLTAVGGAWGQSGSPGWIPADVNRDGAISVLDLTSIGSHWGETW